MNVNWHQIPDHIKNYKPQILATEKPSFELEFTKKNDLQPWNSKLGGLPYLPQAFEYPCNSKGSPLKLLAQINFAELPENDSYPSQGVLQFYIGGSDLYGCDLEQPQNQDDFRVIYFDQVVEDESQLQKVFPEKLEAYNNGELFSPVAGEVAISFKATTQYISYADAGLLQKVIGVTTRSEAEKLLGIDHFYTGWLRAYSKHFKFEHNHRLGGYPYFTQQDPRGLHKDFQDYELLLQIDSIHGDGFEVMWGDLGIGNFFIHPEDLKKRDFSKVVYHWDCG